MPSYIAVGGKNSTAETLRKCFRITEFTLDVQASSFFFFLKIKPETKHTVYFTNIAIQMIGVKHVLCLLLALYMSMASLYKHFV